MPSVQPEQTMSTQERQEYLDRLQKILPADPSFQAWLKKTGELPPDFDALPRVNSHPDPLLFFDGRPVRSSKDWPARRAEIWQLSQRYVLGTFPPKPKIGHVVVLDETHHEGYTLRNVRLELGPDDKGSMRVQVMIPDGGGRFLS
jgi:hypothetical protein